MQYELSNLQIKTIIQHAAEMGAKLTLIRTGHIKPYLNKSEAFRMFGRANIERWIASGLITPRKDGDFTACWRIDRFEVEIIILAKEVTEFF